MNRAKRPRRLHAKPRLRRPGPCAYPPPSAESPAAAAIQVLADDFEFLGDNESRNQYCDRPGNEPARLLRPAEEGHPPRARVHERGVPGRPPLAGRPGPGRVRRRRQLGHRPRADRRAATPVQPASRRPTVLAFDLNGFFDRIGLGSFISSQRRNGLEGMVRRLPSWPRGAGFRPHPRKHRPLGGRHESRPYMPDDYKHPQLGRQPDRAPQAQPPGAARRRAEPDADQPRHAHARKAASGNCSRARSSPPSARCTTRRSRSTSTSWA